MCKLIRKRIVCKLVFVAVKLVRKPTTGLLHACLISKLYANLVFVVVFAHGYAIAHSNFSL